MRNTSIFLVIWVLVDISMNAALAETADLLVRVEAHKSTLVLGEPLFITATVRNEGMEPVQIYLQNSRSYDFVSKNPFLVMISADGNKYEEWSDDLFRITRKRSPMKLAHRAELNSDLVILFSGRHGFAFKQPGEYWISVKVIVHQVPYTGTSFQAEPIRITVIQPARENSDAWNVLSSEKFGKKYGELIQVPWRAKLSVDDLVQFDDMIRLYPHSIYTKYIALFMSRWYGEGPGKDGHQAAHFAEIAKARASSAIVRNLASKVRVNVPVGEIPEQTPVLPVSPELRRKVEVVFQGFIAAFGDEDIDRCLQLQAEDYRGWTRAKQREELQEDIDKIQKLRSNGVSVDISARVLSVVRSGEDLLVTALLSYRQRGEPPEERTVRCRLRKYGDHWLIQDWTTLTSGK